MNLEFRTEPRVTLLRWMGGDDIVAQSARVSTKHERGKTLIEHNPAPPSSADAGLVRRLVTDRHGTPFEHSVFTFMIETSIMVARESHRHRIASISEASLRYMEGLPVVYIPGPERNLIQKPGTKQMDYVTAPGSAVLRHDVDVSFRWAVGHAWEQYQFMLRAGVLREVARGVLPLCFGTKWHLTINARSLMNYLSLRVEDGDAAQVSHPQFEIEQVALLMEGYFAELMPVTYDAFIAGGRLVP